MFYIPHEPTGLSVKSGTLTLFLSTPAGANNMLSDSLLILDNTAIIQIRHGLREVTHLIQHHISRKLLTGICNHV